MTEMNEKMKEEQNNATPNNGEPKVDTAEKKPFLKRTKDFVVSLPSKGFKFVKDHKQGIAGFVAGAGVTAYAIAKGMAVEMSKREAEGGAQNEYYSDGETGDIGTTDGASTEAPADIPDILNENSES